MPTYLSQKTLAGRPLVTEIPDGFQAQGDPLNYGDCAKLIDDVLRIDAVVDCVQDLGDGTFQALVLS
jgi:hypothetical protein